MSTAGSVSTIIDNHRFARAVPVALYAAHGMGPLSAPKGATVAERLTRFANTQTGVLAAIDTIGDTGRRLLHLIGLFGHRLDDERLAWETADADQSEISATLILLQDAGLIVAAAGGGFTLSPSLDNLQWPHSISMTDQHAITSDVLGVMCTRLGVKPGSNRKADRIAAVSTVFADPAEAGRLIGSLSDRARSLLQLIADTGGLSAVPAGSVGLSEYGIYLAGAPRFSHLQRQPNDPDLAALAELTAAGLVGVGEYEREVWIWSEAWPALNRPVHTSWPTVARPEVVPRPESTVQVPSIVVLFDRAIDYWSANPPPVLKNEELRLGKKEIKAAARRLGVSESAIELVSRLAIGTRLLLVNELSRSGRGRNLRVESAWMPDPDAVETWRRLSPQRKWMNLVAYWTRDAPVWGRQLQVNRLLLLWELSSLEPGTGFDSADQLARWIEHRYGPLGAAEAVLEALDDLNVLDVVDADTSSGADEPIGLTDLGRLAIVDFDAVADLDNRAPTDAVIQADLTVIAPRDLDPGMQARLASLATLESDAGALLYRLDESSMAQAIQDGETEDSIVEFLSQLSTVPLDQVVKQFVADAALRARKLVVLDAPSVVICSDPAELALAMKYKSAKLTPVTATVALSSLPPAKLRSVLTNRRLTAALVANGSPAAPRRSSDRAERLELQARRTREHSDLSGNPILKAHAERLAAEAADARDPSLRWRAHGTFAVGQGDLGLDRVVDTAR